MKEPFEITMRRGRRGEIVWFFYLVLIGEFMAFDQSGAAKGKAPILHSAARNIIAPDAWLFHNYQLFGECKTKTIHLPWRNEAEGRLPKGPAQGIDHRAFVDYTTANTKVPVVLFVLCLEDATLYAASLDELGLPILSLQPQTHPIVNWPLSAFAPIATFDAKRLTAFINDPRDILIMPNNKEGQRLLDWLRPKQLEFDWFRTDLLHRLERHWKRDWQQLGDVANEIVSQLRAKT